MSRWSHLNDDARRRWNTNASNWDDYMGDEGNRFHRELVRPATEELLNVEAGQRVLDVGCGNGNFSRRLARRGAEVTGIDFSCALIERARSRSNPCGADITYQVVDATDYQELVQLGEECFDAAVANMVLMDMSDLGPLAAALAVLLKPYGPFVFSVLHPCFRTPDTRMIYQQRDAGGQPKAKRLIKLGRYIRAESCEVTAIPGEPVPSRYFHRPLSDLLHPLFAEGFVLDSMREPVKEEDKEPGFGWTQIPPLMICRLINRSSLSRSS